MIIAHRLLKNGIDSNEYILATQSYLDCFNTHTGVPDLTWHPSSEEYPPIRRLDFQYALLNQIKTDITIPAPKTKLTMTREDGTITTDIHRPMMDVYQTLIDMNNRVRWVSGLKDGYGETPIDRLGTKHLCVFDDGVTEVTAKEREIHENEIRYVEEGHKVEVGLRVLLEYTLKKKPPGLHLSSWLQVPI